MSSIHAYKCDACQTQKSEANHWFVGWIQHIKGGDQFVIAPWDKALADVERVEHFCGEACLQKRLAAFTGGNNGK